MDCPLCESGYYCEVHDKKDNQMSFSPFPPAEIEKSPEEELEDLIRQKQELINQEIELEAKIREARHRQQKYLEKKRQEEIEAKRQAELDAKRKEIEDKQAEIDAIVAEIESHAPKSWENAHPYQKNGVIATHYAFKSGQPGFFNADDMGLGKTFQAICAMELYLKDNPDKNILWLSKSSIVETGGTKREINRWSDIKVIEILGRETKVDREFKVKMLDDHFKGVVLITNYETMRTTKALQKAEFGMVIMDEVHKLKGGANPSGPTGVWKAIRDYLWHESANSNDLVKEWESNVDFILMLSGTPMVNRVAELWAYLHIFDPMKFHNLRQFENAYNTYVELGGNVQTDKILDMCLKDRMVRRTRDEVGLEIPDLNIMYRWVEYTDKQQKAYNDMRDRFFIWLDEQKENALTATAIVAQLTRLRQISVWPVFKQDVKDEYGNIVDTVHINIPESAKIDEAMDIIEEANDQVVVFCNFNAPFDEIKKRCISMGLRCEFITGETKRNMHEYEVGFQNGDIDVLCINSSMGEGLNLQKNPSQWKGGASVGIHLDAWWNPARDDQCNARIHRQGSKEPVFIYKIHAPHSIDDYVKAMSDEKGRMFDGIMEDKRIRPAYEWKSELKEIL